jgi:hypothetical protein
MIISINISKAPQELQIKTYQESMSQHGPDHRNSQSVTALKQVSHAMAPDRSHSDRARLALYTADAFQPVAASACLDQPLSPIY